MQFTFNRFRNAGATRWVALLPRPTRNLALVNLNRKQGDPPGRPYGLGASGVMGLVILNNYIDWFYAAPATCPRIG